MRADASAGRRGTTFCFLLSGLDGHHLTIDRTLHRSNRGCGTFARLESRECTDVTQSALLLAGAG